MKNSPLKIPQNAGERMKIIALFTLGLFFIFYAMAETKNYLIGPKLRVDKPPNGAIIKNGAEISGKIKNITTLYFNNRPILVDTDGNFKEKLILPEGYNIIELKASDKFNRIIKKRLDLVVIKS